MSLFKCERCGCVENTALCGIAWRDKRTGEVGWTYPLDASGHLERALICSECNPQIGRWHGRFPKVDADEAGYVPIEGDSRYIWRPT